MIASAPFRCGGDFVLDTLYVKLALLPMILVGVFAFVKGDEPERVAMGAYLLGWLAGLLTQQDGVMYITWNTTLFLLDFMMLVVFSAIIWRSRRSWAVWAAAMQLLIVMAHFVYQVGLKPTSAAFYTVINLASYGVLVAIAVGTFWAWQERRAAGLE